GRAMRSPASPARNIATIAAEKNDWENPPRWPGYCNDLGAGAVMRIAAVYAPIAQNAATPALNSPVCPHCRFRANAKMAKIDAGMLYFASSMIGEETIV